MRFESKQGQPQPHIHSKTGTSPKLQNGLPTFLTLLKF